jgi:hypothetical protein
MATKTTKKSTAKKSPAKKKFVTKTCSTAGRTLKKSTRKTAKSRAGAILGGRC